MIMLFHPGAFRGGKPLSEHNCLLHDAPVSICYIMVDGCEHLVRVLATKTKAIKNTSVLTVELKLPCEIHSHSTGDFMM